MWRIAKGKQNEFFKENKQKYFWNKKKFNIEM